MADAAIQNTVFSGNRLFNRFSERDGDGLMSSLARNRNNRTADRAGITSNIRDRFEPDNDAPSFGAEKLTETLSDNFSPDALKTAAALYAEAGPRTVRQGTLFTGNGASSSFASLADNLSAAIRSGLSLPDTARTPASISQAAHLYRQTGAGISGQTGLLPQASLFGGSYGDASGPPAITSLAETAGSITATLTGASRPSLSSTSALYLSTGYRLFQTPQLLLDMFA